MILIEGKIVLIDTVKLLKLLSLPANKMASSLEIFTHS